MKTVITYGTFDMLHYGHISLLERAKTLGDRLIVGLSTDEFNQVKGKRSHFNWHERRHFLSSIKYVDLIIPETSWEQKISDVREYDVSIFAIGDDWRGKFDYLCNYCSVVYLSRTEGISTSLIKTAFSKNNFS